MFGWGRRDPFRGVAFPHTVWTGLSAPKPGEVREIVASLAVAPVRGLKRPQYTLDEAVDALGDWLAAEDESLRDEFVNPETGKDFDLSLSRSDPKSGAVWAAFRLTTRGLAGGTMYGSSVRRVGPDQFVLDIDGKD